ASSSIPHANWRGIFMRPKLARLLSSLLIVTILQLGQIKSLQAQSPSPDCSDLALKSTLINSFDTGFTRAEAPYTFSFPKDYGAHLNFQLEWWYYTGNLATTEGRRFGYQFTIFRYGILPPQEARTANRLQLYAADLAISDIQGQQYYSDRIRPSFGDAGVKISPMLHLWVRDWEMTAQDPNAQTMRLQASASSFGFDLTTTQIKPPALNGDHGLSVKGPLPGEASYYYSLTRLPTTGTLTIDDTAYNVTGDSWMDHEFSSGALDESAQGWDWFAIQL